jgi:crotonobetainyl-CoA:carnitine CoA-transferase CaiB-like acyl-CoA transferase
MKSVLEDIRVLDFGRFVAGPYCGMLLADMGAEVIRVERPGGEEDRTVGLTGPDGQNLAYASYARNKKGITLNLLNNEHGRETLADLVGHCDVVLHSFSPEAAGLMGLTYAELKKIKADIILTAVSCFGSSGPYANRIGFDFIAQAMSGAMKMGGFPDKPPQRAYMLPMDYGTGLAAAFGTMIALRHRDQTGEGQKVDLSLFQTALAYITPQIAEAEILGKLRPMIGNRAAYVGPTDLYRCKNGYIFIATIMNSLWRRLAKLIGREELISDPELQTDYQRYEHRHRIDPLVANWAAGHTVNEALEKLDKARIPCSPVRNLDEIVDDPHVRSENMIEYVDMQEPGLNKLPVSGIQAKLSKTPGRVVTRAPRVGEHNDEIYRGLLGYDKVLLNELKEKAVI